MRIATISTFAPEQCGIAYYSRSLMSAMQQAVPEVSFLTIGSGSSPPSTVDLAIERGNAASLHNAFQAAHEQGCDAVLIQHEFGLFGGDSGCFLTSAARASRLPVVPIFHTILRRPSTIQLENMRGLAAASAKVIAPSAYGRELLVSHYDVHPDKIEILPHGCPDFQATDALGARAEFDWPGRTVILTYGLLSPGKRIEDGIAAIGHLAAERPQLLYIVAGATHPNLLRPDGDPYRDALERQREELGLTDHVQFLDRRFSDAEIHALVGRADIALCAYGHQEQIVSGTLSMMMAAGNPIVATPFWHARDASAQGAALLVPFGSPAKIAEAIAAILDDPVLAAGLRQRAQELSRPHVWASAGKQVVTVLGSIIRQPRPVFPEPSRPASNLAHLEALTTSTGLLQHCRWSIPNFAEGYCTDDNARALMLCCALAERSPVPGIERLANTYLAFLLYAFNKENHRFRNLLAFDGRWQDVCGSEECHARALRAFVHLMRSSLAESRQELAREIFDAGLGAVDGFTSLRAKAIALIAFSEALGAGLMPHLGPYARRLAGDLRQVFSNTARDWPWPEPDLSWGNAKVAHALIAFGDVAQNEPVLQLGLATLRWLLELQVTPDGMFSPIPMPAGRSIGAASERFDQQPIEAWATLAACSAAYRATGKSAWKQNGQIAFDWFRGGNAHRMNMTDDKTGACYDGLTANGVNRNQGAESTLAWQLALCEASSLSPMENGRTM